MDPEDSRNVSWASQNHPSPSGAGCQRGRCPPPRLLDAVIHLWGATDEDWRSRVDLTHDPICSGAESFLAGTASCRIEAEDVDGLHAELLTF